MITAELRVSIENKQVNDTVLFVSGWLGGPMPAVGQKEDVATGWEEPSPESIRRRMEIDDGTAAWGDPGKELLISLPRPLFTKHE